MTPDTAPVARSVAAQGDSRPVVTDGTAGMFAAAPGDALIAKEGAVITKTTFHQWLESR